MHRAESCRGDTLPEKGCDTAQQEAHCGCQDHAASLHAGFHPCCKQHKTACAILEGNLADTLDFSSCLQLHRMFDMHRQLHSGYNCLLYE